MEAPQFKSQDIYRIEQGFKYIDDDYWEWWVWIESSDDHLDKIEHVTYVLHPTFYNPKRDINDRKTKFLLKAKGWGTFTLFANLHLKNGEEIHLEHDLNLEYPDGTKTNA